MYGPHAREHLCAFCMCQLNVFLRKFCRVCVCDHPFLGGGPPCATLPHMFPVCVRVCVVWLRGGNENDVYIRRCARIGYDVL